MAVYAHRLLHDVKDRAARRHGDSDGVARRRRGSFCDGTGGRGRERYLILDCHIDVTRKARGAHLHVMEACTMCVCVFVYVCVCLCVCVCVFVCVHVVCMSMGMIYIYILCAVHT